MSREEDFPGRVRLTVQVVPNAKRSEVVGMHDDAVKIRLHAPAIEGKANEALIRFIAEVLDLPRNAVQVIHGHTARRKLVDISVPGMMADTARQVLLETIGKQ